MQHTWIFPNPVTKPDLAKELLSRLYYADPSIESIEILPDGSGANFELDGTEIVPVELEHRAGKIFDTITGDFVSLNVQVAFDQSDVTPVYTGNIYEELLSGGHIQQVGKGTFTFGPLFVAVMHALDDLVVEFAQKVDAAEYSFPTLMPAELLHRCNYFTSFPHYLTMTFHLPEDQDVIEAFSKAAGEREHINSLPVADVTVENALSPAVCYHVYNTIEGLTFEPGEDGRAFLCKGKCFRYESGNMNMVERMWDFTMREVVFVGKSDFVLGSREKSLEWIKGVLIELGLKCRIETASDPFFAGEDMKKRLFQNALQLKYEILCELPHSGKNLAVGSLNFHQNFFGKTFDITCDGQPASTGCTAFGVERWALAFLAQYGTDTANWPQIMREKTGL